MIVRVSYTALYIGVAFLKLELLKIMKRLPVITLIDS